MLFILVFFAFCFVVTFAICWFWARSSITKQWQLEGPNRVGERLRKRNRVGFFILFSILVILAFFEALIQDFSYWMQDLQADTFTETLPEWSYVLVGNGSISWALYLAIFLGVFLGIVLGSWRACRQYPELKSIRPFDLI